MDWNIIFFEIALVSLLVPIGIGLFVVLSSIKGILETLTDSANRICDKLNESASRDKDLDHRLDLLEIKLGVKKRE